MDKVFASRRRALQARMKEAKLDRLVVTHPADWYYLTGFTGDSGALVISGESGKAGASLVTDGRFTSQAADETSGVRIVPQAGALYPATGKFLGLGRGRAVGFDPTQLTVAQHTQLHKAAGKRIPWRAVPGLGVGLGV